jgi:hypothetical protein
MDETNSEGNHKTTSAHFNPLVLSEPPPTGVLSPDETDAILLEVEMYE